VATTAPEQVRDGLLLVTAAGAGELRTVATTADQTPTAVRDALFVAAPLIVSDYGNAAATLAADWYEELRDAASPRRAYVPRLVVPLDENSLSTSVAVATQPLYDFERELQGMTQAMEADFQKALEDSLAAMEAEIQKEIAAGFRETITENAVDDPESHGWKRFAQPDACKFCKMLADKGAVFTEKTARFAAHGAYTGGKKTGGNCMCIAGPEFGGKQTWVEATPMQYLASKRKRSDADKAKLRAYLNEHFPDAPG
jgi:hypothetical protein